MVTPKANQSCYENYGPSPDFSPLRTDKERFKEEGSVSVISGSRGEKKLFHQVEAFPFLFCWMRYLSSLSLSLFPYSFPRFSLPYSHFSERRHASTTPSDGLCLTCLRSALTLMPKTNAGWIESPWFFRRQSYKDIVTAESGRKIRNCLA